MLQKRKSADTKVNRYVSLAEDIVRPVALGIIQTGHPCKQNRAGAPLRQSFTMSGSMPLMTRLLSTLVPSPVCPHMRTSPPTSHRPIRAATISNKCELIERLPSENQKGDSHRCEAKR